MKSKLHVLPGAADREGRVLNITPASADWEYVGFELYRLAPGQSISRTNDGMREICAVVVSGSAIFQCGPSMRAETVYRDTPFSGQTWAMYAPIGCHWTVTAKSELELAICSAPANTSKPPRIISPLDTIAEKRGTGTNTRFVTDFLPEHEDWASGLLVVEAITPAGNWSSYPPHKHDQDALPHESKLEEVYYHRIQPASGFAVQRVYTSDGSLDETISVRNGEVVLVPRGYHPVGAPHGYDLYYLNVMAGPKRIWKTQVDPDHVWLLNKVGEPEKA